MRARRLLGASAAGAIGGGIATGVMSVVMLGARRVGLITELPPERITASALDAAGLHARTEGSQDALATLLHAGFGITAGALFGLLYRPSRLPIPPVAQGIIFGSVLWLVSYSGWVPALGIMPPPARDEPRRPVVMVLAHWIYGAVLGVIVERTRRES